MLAVSPKRSALTYLRLVLAIVLLFVLFGMIDLQKMGVTLAAVNPHFVIAAFLVMVFNYGLKTLRWASILWIQKSNVTFWQIARVNFISIFLGNFLPTSLSFDIVRIYFVSQSTADPRLGISSIFVDRILGNFALAVVTIIAFLALDQTGLLPIRSMLSYGIVAFLILTLGVPLAFTSTAMMNSLRRLLDRFAGKVLFESVQDLSRHLRLYWHQTGVMMKALTIAFLNLAIAVFEVYLIARAFSAPVSIGYFFIFIPLIIFLCTLPISLGGLGIMEAGLVFFFSRVGMPIETCLGTALVFRALQMMLLLPGAVIYLADGFSVKELPAQG
jgi:glycosyltransferase 2 family protein